MDMFPDPSAQLQCTMCGATWIRMQQQIPGNHPGNGLNGVGHTEAEWETWRISQSYADGMPYPRFRDPNAPPPLPEPPSQIAPPQQSFPLQEPPQT